MDILSCLLKEIEIKSKWADCFWLMTVWVSCLSERILWSKETLGGSEYREIGEIMECSGCFFWWIFAKSKESICSCGVYSAKEVFPFWVFWWPSSHPGFLCQPKAASCSLVFYASGPRLRHLVWANWQFLLAFWENSRLSYSAILLWLAISAFLLFFPAIDQSYDFVSFSSTAWRALFLCAWKWWPVFWESH